jgi:hypothetical protein
MPEDADQPADRTRRLANAIAYADGFPSLQVSDEFMAMDAKQIRAMRLAERYGSVNDAHGLVGEEGFR